jgi:hypothetical protein
MGSWNEGGAAVNETVTVALIVGGTGVLAGLSPALLTGRFTRKQAEADARREHDLWLRNERYLACSQLLEEAAMIAPRALQLRAAKLADGAGTDLAVQYVGGIEPLYRAVSRIGVLGPRELEVAAGQVGAAAMQNQTAHLQGGTQDEKRAGDQAQVAADEAFRLVAQRVLSARLQPNGRTASRFRRRRKSDASPPPGP